MSPHPPDTVSRALVAFHQGAARAPAGDPARTRKTLVDRVLEQVFRDIQAGHGAVEDLGAVWEALLDLELQPEGGSGFRVVAEESRRSRGVHFTPPDLARSVVEDTLGPLLERDGPPSSDRILSLRVCDTAAGAGAFLVAALRALGDRLVEAGAREGVPLDPREARIRVLRSCLAGVELDATTARVARWSLALAVGEGTGHPVRSRSGERQGLGRAVRAGDALLVDWARVWPDVFARENPGFDAVVGNPPFVGGRRLRSVLGEDRVQVLRSRWPDVEGGADLCAFFLRQAGALLRDGGCLGLILPSNVAGGASRRSGLAPLLQEGGNLYEVRVHQPWPGAGAVTPVSIVHLASGWCPRTPRLDGREVSRISSWLTEGPEEASPLPLPANQGRCFGGCVIDGEGFTLTPCEARELGLDPRVVRPFLGGDEVNTRPDQGFERYVIDFTGLDLDQARQWPVLLERVERLVRPQRQGHKEARAREVWWQFRRTRPALRRALAPLDRCIVCSMVSMHLVFAFQPTDRVFSHKLAVVADDSWFTFGCLQSRVHESWARRFGVRRGPGLAWTPSTCFDPFPFPPWSRQVEEAAETLYGMRDALARRTPGGLAAVWGRVRDPEDGEPALVKLREARDALDRAVLRAWGWEDLEPDQGDRVVERLILQNRGLSG